MPDNNTLLSELQREGREVEKNLRELLKKYEYLHKNSSRQYEEEGSLPGAKDLDDFYILVQSIKRNKEIVGSLILGISRLESLSEFKFIQQDIPAPKPKTSKQVKTKNKKEIKIEDVSDDIFREFANEPVHREKIEENNKDGK